LFLCKEGHHEGDSQSQDGLCEVGGLTWLGPPHPGEGTPIVSIRFRFKIECGCQRWYGTQTLLELDRMGFPIWQSSVSNALSRPLPVTAGLATRLLTITLSQILIYYPSSRNPCFFPSYLFLPFCLLPFCLNLSSTWTFVLHPFSPSG
jgi:hypothetical protein